MLLQEGDNNANVLILQRGLRIMCCDPNGLDGIFGPGCTAAVKKFQTKMGIEPVNGICGDDTWNTLLSEIYEIQILLQAKGYNTGGLDGKAGPQTYNAVLQFQQDNGLTADGMIGDQTWAKLMAAGDGVGGNDGLPLQPGDRGSKVLCAQYALRILCCSPGAIDGTFGSRTAAAVEKFQGNYGLTVDGIVGEATWNKLCAEIQTIQQALKTKGYSILVDGLAGLDTYETVRQFQADNGLSKDGQVGAATREKLFGTTGEGVDGLPLKEGQSGDMITFLQRALRIAIINCTITGTFDAQTKTCVVRYQGRNGLTADGIVGVKTWEKLRENVRKYQNALQNKGYDVGEIDGIASDKTYNAILQFQSDNGLDADGMCGTQTQTKLFGASQGGGTTSSTLKLGSDGSLTRYLQIMLNTMGYSLSVDGIFGANVEAAVKDFQSKNGLTADGICGGGTWSELFSQYQVDVPGTGVQKFVNVAKHEAQIGFHEDNGNNINPYGQWYGNNGSAWCAMFVSFCAEQAGILDTIVPRYAYTPSGANWYRNRDKYHKRTSSYSPKVGDTVFFFDASKGRIAHTGIVTLVTSSLIYTIEGNASDGVIERRYSRSDSYIDGYGDNGGITETTPLVTTMQGIVMKVRELENIYRIHYPNCEVGDMGCALSVLDFCRRREYNDFEWSLICGSPNTSFFEYVKNDNRTLYDEFDNYVTDNGKHILGDYHEGQIDFPHFAAVTQAYLKRRAIVELALKDFWAGWGGDLGTEIGHNHKLYTNDPSKTRRQYADEYIGTSKQGSKFSLSDMCADADAIKIAEMIATNVNDSTKYIHPVSEAIEYYYNTPGVYQKRYKYLLNDICKQQTNTAFDPEYITLENLKLVVKHIMNNVDNDALLIRFKGELPFGTGESINPTCESFATFVFNRK